ncbi:MAG: hypothetical protein KAT49_00760 [Methanomicrobia archaeon]|nr:hypothetical protein [Methanomicrobia archaeon]
MSLEEEIGVWKCLICRKPLKEEDEYVEIAFFIGKMESSDTPAFTDRRSVAFFHRSCFRENIPEAQEHIGQGLSWAFGVEAYMAQKEK